MEDCCKVDEKVARLESCPRCGRTGRSIDRVTLKALLKPRALERLGSSAYRFCATADCKAVYFGPDGVYERADLAVSVFQKESDAGRTVCYCLGITEATIRDEIASTGRSTASERITALIKAERCACEIRNPQGSCCLGNVTVLTREADFGEEQRVSAGALPISAASRDLAAFHRAGFLIWGLPLIVLLASAPLSTMRPLVWPAALFTMGIGCVANASRCGRMHCYFTSVFFLALAALSAAHGQSWLSLGEAGWLWLGVVFLLGTVVLIWLPERLWGRYRT